MIRNIIFDMGNVLLTYEPETFVRKLCSEKAAPVILRELFLGPDWRKQDLGLIGKKELFELVSVRVPAIFHPDLWNAVDHWSDLMQPISGADAFIRRMKTEGYRLFVLSNAGTDFYRYFPPHYALSLFDGLTISCDLHIAKPDREIYMHLMESFGLLPEECMFTNDMQENVAGAEACGMHGFRFQGDFEALSDTVCRIK